MSRKEKVEKAQKRRQQQTVVNPALADAVQKDITEKGSVDASTAPVAAIKNDAELANSREISRLGGVNAEKLGYTVNDGVLKNPLEVQNKGLEQNAEKGLTQAQAKTINVPQVTQTTEEAPAFQAITLSDMLAEQRQKAEQEKTDAAKMQKYYALADAFAALGKMGGTAIGGAIGGNIMDSAPVVEGYQPNRGYLDAIEKSKKASDRLKELDEKEFNLAVRDEERSYKQQIDKLNRDYQKAMVDYKNKIDRANAEQDFARKQELVKEQARIEQEMKEKNLELQHKYEMETLGLKNKYRQSEKAGSRANMQFQHDLYNSIPIAFENGTGIKMPKNEYEAMLKFFKGRKIGGVTIDDKNIDGFISKNPQLVNDFITAIGGKGSVSSQNTGTEAPNQSKPTAKTEQIYHTGYAVPMGGMDAYNQYKATSPRNLVETEENLEEIKKGIADYKD